MKYRQKLVPADKAAKVTYSTKNKQNYIVVHETDNTGTGANADAHARLQFNGNSRGASWHWTVDDKEAVQSFPHTASCWAAGTDKGNLEGIQVEICVNQDGNFGQALENAAALVNKLMKDLNIPISRVVQHNHFSGKNCPRNIRAAKPMNWSTFLTMVERAGGIAVPKQPQADRTQYVVKTGGWKDKRHAENSADVMKFRFGWKPQIVQYEGLWLIKAGTWTSEEFANEAVRKIMDALLAPSAYKAKL